MSHIKYFQKQAKLLLKDWKQREQKYSGFNIRELFRFYHVNPHEEPTLMKAQHLLAQALGRKSWSELIHDSEEQLEYTKNALIENLQEEKEVETFLNKNFPKKTLNVDTLNENDVYHGIVECLHCGQRFPIDKPNHLPSCSGEDWDLIPVEKI